MQEAKHHGQTQQCSIVNKHNIHIHLIKVGYTLLSLYQSLKASTLETKYKSFHYHHTNAANIVH
uniref:Uncharacterized protein n=1 Tax=Rhizophora mucronata TaxID=61149 RepID=A0A2P2J4K7_RHIMU